MHQLTELLTLLDYVCVQIIENPFTFIGVLMLAGSGNLCY